MSTCEISKLKKCLALACRIREIIKKDKDEYEDTYSCIDLFDDLLMKRGELVFRLIEAREHLEVRRYPGLRMFPDFASRLALDYDLPRTLVNLLSEFGKCREEGLSGGGDSFHDLRCRKRIIEVLCMMAEIEDDLATIRDHIETATHSLLGTSIVVRGQPLCVGAKVERFQRMRDQLESDSRRQNMIYVGAQNLVRMILNQSEKMDRLSRHLTPEELGWRQDCGLLKDGLSRLLPSLPRSGLAPVLEHRTGVLESTGILQKTGIGINFTAPPPDRLGSLDDGEFRPLRRWSAPVSSTEVLSQTTLPSLGWQVRLTQRITRCFRRKTHGQTPTSYKQLPPFIPPVVTNQPANLATIPRLPWYETIFLLNGTIQLVPLSSMRLEAPFLPGYNKREDPLNGTVYYSPNLIP